MIVTLSLVVVVAAACGDSGRIDEPAPQANETAIQVESGDSGGGDLLEGTGWMATSITGEDVLPQFPVTMQFDAAGQVDGSAGCNLYAGTYEVEGSTITIAVGPTTRRACEEQQGGQETSFLEALAAAVQFDISDAEMTLQDAEGVSVASFESG